jgi:polyribonucleotide nucleotidyltransferase
MDFKIAGTCDAETAMQLDVKEPVPVDVLIRGLELARAGRRAIINEMDAQAQSTLGRGLPHRPEPKESAPRVAVVRFDPQRKRDLVGPGGVVLRQLEERYGVSVDLTQEGQCLLYGADRDMVDKARKTVMDLVADVVEGEVYHGT